MCGILTLLSCAGPVDSAAAARALGQLAHRGPDGAGEAVLWDGQLFLGHRRLGIFDPGEGGHQPMTDPQTGSTLIFNGAIYNYRELRQELKALGHRFAGGSDTEVLLTGWRQWGEALLPRLNGMWAFVLLDVPAGRLVVCRDRMGVKPLWWRRQGNRLAFGSTALAVAAAAGGGLVPDPVHVFDFLLMGQSHHREGSFYRDLQQVPAGEVWSVTRDGTVTRRQWHQWQPRPQAGGEEVRALLADATALRLRADVPVGLLLSGGLDSAIVGWGAVQPGAQAESGAGSAAGAGGRLDRVFTYGYEPGSADPHDETAGAMATAGHLGLGERLEVLRVPPLPPRSDLDRLMENYQVPFGTPSVLAAFRLYRQMRAAGVTVVLNGEASDELFGGYTRRYAALLARDALRRGDLRQVMALLASPHLSGRDFMARLVWDLPGDLTRRLFRACQPSARAIAPDFWQAQAGLFRERQADLRQPLAGRLRQDVLTGALPAILSWADSGSMAWGVEVRSPFLDWRVVEAALSLPPSAKVTDRGGKRILREAFSGLLPDRVIAAPKTHGLGMAEQFTMGRMALDDLLEQPPAGTAEFLDLAVLRHELTRHPGTMPLWWPICLLLWLRFLERQA